ncbi:hypothetical protein [Brucella microti]|uniref:hypothetical protein n=1 Tax=Brucella microti TaxID=444163 RepID=UPI0005A1AD9D|nr:hypothetical protein [Brucella microti]
MSLHASTKSEVATSFNPQVTPASNGRDLSGERRQFHKTKSVKLLWPEGSANRFQLFDAWHDVAMQILHRQKAGLRVIAISKKVIRWSNGSIVGSNEELAIRAGYCSPKTISREIQSYVALGLLVSNLDWKRPGGGKFVTVRELHLALPNPLPEWVRLPDNEHLSRDNSGPDLATVSLDRSGPGGRDNSGPATIDH